MSQKTFRLITHQQEFCPWCGKIGLMVSATKKSVMRLCFHHCGYRAFIPKKLLTFKQRIKYYDPKRFVRMPM